MTCLSVLGLTASVVTGLASTPAILSKAPVGPTSAYLKQAAPQTLKDALNCHYLAWVLDSFCELTPKEFVRNLNFERNDACFNPTTTSYLFVGVDDVIYPNETFCLQEAQLNSLERPHVSKCPEAVQMGRYLISGCAFSSPDKLRVAGLTPSHDKESLYEYDLKTKQWSVLNDRKIADRSRCVSSLLTCSGNKTYTCTVFISRQGKSSARRFQLNAFARNGSHLNSKIVTTAKAELDLKDEFDTKSKYQFASLGGRYLVLQVHDHPELLTDYVIDAESAKVLAVTHITYSKTKKTGEKTENPGEHKSVAQP